MKPGKELYFPPSTKEVSKEHRRYIETLICTRKTRELITKARVKYSVPKEGLRFDGLASKSLVAESTESLQKFTKNMLDEEIDMWLTDQIFPTAHRTYWQWLDEQDAERSLSMKIASQITEELGLPDIWNEFFEMYFLFNSPTFIPSYFKSSKGAPFFLRFPTMHNVGINIFNDNSGKHIRIDLYEKVNHSKWQEIWEGLMPFLEELPAHAYKEQLSPRKSAKIVDLKLAGKNSTQIAVEMKIDKPNTIDQIFSRAKKQGF